MAIRTFEPIDYVFMVARCARQGCDPNELFWVMTPFVFGGMYRVVDNIADAQRGFRVVNSPTEPLPTWVVMGTNDAGSVVMGTTTIISGTHLESAIDAYGPGVILTGRHGGVYPQSKAAEFYMEDFTW
jgi:hypothetical protein